MNASSPASERHHQVAPVLERGRRRRVDEYVAQEAAAEAGGPGQDEDAEHVEALADRHERARDREHEDAQQVEDDQGGGHVGVSTVRG